MLDNGPTSAQGMDTGGTTGPTECKLERVQAVLNEEGWLFGKVFTRLGTKTPQPELGCFHPQRGSLEMKELTRDGGIVKVPDPAQAYLRCWKTMGERYRHILVEKGIHIIGYR